MRKLFALPTCILATLSLVSCGVSTASDPDAPSNPSSAEAASRQTVNRPSAPAQPTASNSEALPQSLLSASLSDTQDSIRPKFSLADFNHKILAYSATHVAGLVPADKTVRVADLSSGQDILRVGAEDLKLPASVEFMSFQRATLLSGSIIIESTVSQGKDAYNMGKEKTAYSIFDIKEKNLLGEVILGPSVDDSSADQSLLNRKPLFSINWEAGIPGKSIALVSDRQGDFTSSSAQGNIVLFQDGQAPSVLTHDSEQLKNAYFLHKDDLVQIENSRVMNAYFQISADEVIREPAQAQDPYQLLQLDSGGRIISSRNLPPAVVTRPESWTSPYFCAGEDKQNFVSHFATLEMRDLGDVSCQAVSPNGTVLGQKGDRHVPVLLSPGGSLIDIPSDLHSVQLVNDSLLYDGSSFYEYSFK